MSFTPDPTFYPSPRSAIEAPPEELAYVVTLNEAGTGAAAEGATGDPKPDALVVVDLSTGEKVGRLDMPNVGDELHHFGWNACSSALCPWAPHPHVERRYFLIPGLKSSRIHVVDVKDDPRAPKLVKVIEPDELHHKTGYSRPHTIHCGPDGLYVSALGAPPPGGPAGGGGPAGAGRPPGAAPRPPGPRSPPPPPAGGGWGGGSARAEGGGSPGPWSPRPAPPGPGACRRSPSRSARSRR